MVRVEKPMQDTPADLLFSATLTPPRVPSVGGRWLVGGLVSLLGILPAIGTVTTIGWPIAVLMGLDAVAIGLVLRFSNQLGKTSEQISLWADRLQITRHTTRGAMSEHQFEPFVTRLVIERDFDERTTGLHVRSGQDDLELGAFLSADDKSSFAKVFGTALRKARNSAVKTGS